VNPRRSRRRASVAVARRRSARRREVSRSSPSDRDRARDRSTTRVDRRRDVDRRREVRRDVDREVRRWVARGRVRARSRAGVRVARARGRATMDAVDASRARDGDDARDGRANARASANANAKANATAGTSRTATRSACAFVARAQALVAELGRLADRVPRAVSDVRGKFASVLLDYEYFDSPLTCDDKIESSGTLLELDEEFRASHGRMLERYWNAFDACVRWHSDFTRFVEDVTEGTYVSDTMEKLLADEDGKQCVIEAMAGVWVDAQGFE
jgi:hypothetical protein